MAKQNVKSDAKRKGVKKSDLKKIEERKRAKAKMLSASSDVNKKTKASSKRREEEYYARNDRYDEYDEYEDDRYYEDNYKDGGRYADEYVDDYQGDGRYEGTRYANEYDEYEGSQYADEYEDDYDDYDERYDDEYDDDYNDSYGRVDYHRDETGFGAIKDTIVSWFSRRSKVDLVMMGFGALALVIMVVAGTIFFKSTLSSQGAEDGFATLGADAQNIGVIGESGLLAALDAKKAEIDALSETLWNDEEEEIADDSQVPENVDAGKTVIVLNLTSIQKDLKIKFVNHKTNKVVKGIEFQVDIKDPSGKKISKTNTDKDGIIYLKNITPGKYTVALVGPDNDDLSFLKDPVSITVKDSIEYKKVDISDEIKSEKEINAAKEDTAKNDTVIESTLTDTVEYVESTKTLIEGSDTSGSEYTYEEVKKEDIQDPGKTAYLGMKLLGKRYEPVDPPVEEPTAEPTAEPQPTEAPAATPEPTAEPTAEPTQQPTATPAPTEAPAATPSPTATAGPTATVSPSPSPSVSPSPSPSGAEKAKQDTTSPLKARENGYLLYIKVGDEYKEAHYADYYKEGIKFYKKVPKKTQGKYKYTGWQDIDGYRYYYDKNGNYVTGEQVIQGAKYTFDSEGRLNKNSGVLGIDVSKWNGNIDWNAVKNSGVSYVIIRCGYRGSTVGALVEDPMFKANAKGAAAAGLKIGVYFFSQAVDEIEAVEEASMVLSLVKGNSLPYGVFLDVESSGGRADGISADMRTKVCDAFCKTIENSGYRAGVYANKTWFTSMINTPNISGHKIWLAQYAAAPTYNRTRYDIWQYTSKGSVNGIKGNVDMDISFLGY